VGDQQVMETGTSRRQQFLGAGRFLPAGRVSNGPPFPPPEFLMTVSSSSLSTSRGGIDRVEEQKRLFACRNNMRGQMNRFFARFPRPYC